MTPANLLRTAQAKIATPDTWCTGTHALAADGTPVEPDAPDATCWCAAGALASLTSWAQTRTVITRLDAAAKALYNNGTIVSINDHVGFDAVHACYDHAIAQAEEEDPV